MIRIIYEKQLVFNNSILNGSQGQDQEINRFKGKDEESNDDITEVEKIPWTFKEVTQACTHINYALSRRPAGSKDPSWKHHHKALLVLQNNLHLTQE
ncbi:hypothetical protein O181_005128 [Austropuccinia psidii MF-1]|uniref:Uncharacterized protein n=1 Tax=Austropuccinia psidii MF-1 TaxID=1389203 RepID=A0A9Q3GF85_9BASI|nr:hypothetical protein [Austropuccinia psidii MF-1]